MPNDALSPPPGAAVEDMLRNARDASNFLKALAHEGRLTILCYLVEGERTVGELEQLLGARQPAVSQQLARLRLDGLVATRREGKAIYYRLGDERVERLIETLHAIFCANRPTARGPTA
jgi:DNA-binding transcriptional ArsR family regulator